uniref:Microtubule-binding protein n=1 Tax=Panagrellus redivivus TaxID=6233 RepID=A0A7E4V9D8_PANRE
MVPDSLTQHVNAMLTKYSGLVTTSEEAHRLRASFTNLFQNETTVVGLRRLLDVIEEIVSSKSPQVDLLVRDITTAHRYITARKIEVDRATKQLNARIAAIAKSANPVELRQVMETLQAMKVSADKTFQTEKKLQQALVRRLNERIGALTSFTQQVREYPSKIAETDSENKKILTQLQLACATKDSLETQLAELVQNATAQQYELKRQSEEQEAASARIETLVGSKDAADAEIVKLEALDHTLHSEIDAAKTELDALHAKNEETLDADRSEFQAELAEATSSLEARKTKFAEIQKRHDDTNAHLKDVADEEISVDLKLQKANLDIAETLAKITQQEDDYQMAKAAKERHEREQVEVLEAERRARQEQARISAEKAEAERLRREEEARVQAEKDRRLAEFEAKEAAEQERKQKIREKRLQRKREREGHSKHDAASDYHSDTSSVYNQRDARSTPFPSKKPKDVRGNSASCVPRKAKSVAPESDKRERYSSSDSDDNYVPTPEKRLSKKQRASSSELFVSESHSAEDKEHFDIKDKNAEFVRDSLEAGIKTDKTPIKKEALKSDSDFHDTLEVFDALTKVETPVSRRKLKTTVEEEEARKTKIVPKERTSHKSKPQATQEPLPEVYSSRRPQRASTRTAQRNIHDQLKQLQVQFSDEEEEDKNAYVPKKNVNATPDKKKAVVKKAIVTPDKNPSVPEKTVTPKTPVPPKLPTKPPKIAPPPVQMPAAYTEAEMSFWDC